MLPDRSCARYLDGIGWVALACDLSEARRQLKAGDYSPALRVNYEPFMVQNGRGTESD